MRQQRSLAFGTPVRPLLAGAGFLLLGVLAACDGDPASEVAPPGLVLTPVSLGDLPGWEEDRVAEALPALRRSCAHLAKRNPSEPLGPGRLAGTVADWQPACRAAAQLDAGDEAGFRRLLLAEFVPYRAENLNGKPGLFTGYYEAALDGALNPDETYRWPLYRQPSDQITVDLDDFATDGKLGRLIGRTDNGRLVPYYTRAEIDRGALEGRGLELLWVKDPIDAFFLHIQGSGRVRLPDGTAQRVGYAGSNGHRFTAIGRALVEEGKISGKSASMQTIRDWLRANPEEGQEIMQRNKRYIFFREIGKEGPVGAQGVALTAGRSLAVDPTFMPYGAPLWLDTTWPASDRPLRRLLVAQDTGSAIKGPVRGDLYWGSGEAALEQAGRMSERGTYYLFLPKAVAQRRGAGS